MKQSKFSLADVLTALTALGYAFICYLAKNFSTLGNTLESITWAVIIAFTLGGMAYVAKRLKRVDRNFKTNFILEIGTLLLFTGLMVFYSYTVFSHYFTVTGKKAEIQKKLQASISKAETMFTEYETYADTRKTSYEAALNGVIALQRPAELQKYGFSNPNTSVPYADQKAHKLNTLNNYLFPSNYSDAANNKGIKEVATEWLANAKSITSNWKSIGVVNVVNEVETVSQGWLTQLQDFSKKQLPGMQPLYFDDYDLTFDDVKFYFTTTEKPGLMSIGLSVCAYLLMLLSFLISKRSTKTSIRKTKAETTYDIKY